MKKVKIIVDILMVIVFILLMCNQLTGIFAHEILGVSVIVLFIIHQILNRNFYKNLFKGKYNKLRIAFLIIDILLLIMMIIMIFSSLMVSQHLFKALDFGSNYLGRVLHIISAYSIYMLIGLHLGLHYNYIIKFKKENKIILNVFLILFALVFGINGFIKKEFISKITLQSMYPLYSEDGAIMIFIDYIGIFIMFTMIGYEILNLLSLKKKNKKNEKVKTKIIRKKEYIVKDFVYNKIPTVYFGEGVLKKNLPSELAKVGNNVMLSFGGGSIKRTGLYDEVMSVLKEAGKNVVEFSGIMSNPTYAKVQEGAKLAKENNVDFILAVGGGSVIDCCKIVSAQAKTDEDIWKMEFQYRKFPTEFVKLASVVTASGTGAEMNNGAVITNEDVKLKAGMLGALSDFVILDPSYTLTVPEKQVISGAFDTLSHCMGTYFGKPAKTNVSDEITESIMRNVIKNIREVIKNPEDVNVRSELMWDSSLAECGLLKLGKVTDFQAHQIEHQLGAYTDCNHGQGLAIIHPKLYNHIYKENISKFARFAREVWNVESDNDEEAAKRGIEELDNFIKEIGMPTTLKEIDISDKEMLRKVANSSNITAGCCKQLTHDEIYEILLECL